MLLGWVAAACAGKTLAIPDAFAHQTPGVTDKEIRLGAWIPLIGPVAPYGVRHRAGIEASLSMSTTAEASRRANFA